MAAVAMLNTRTLSNGTVVAQSERGIASMTKLKEGVLLYVCSGYFLGEFYEAMVDVAQNELQRHGSLVMLVDGWDLSGVDTDFREAWTDWFKLYTDRFSMTLLVRSPLMKMAASLANLLTGVSVISIYASVDSWERACSRDVAGFRRNVERQAL